jgi:hypothetical protein
MQPLDSIDILAPDQNCPHALTVLMLLSLAAFVFSYLIAYALPGALISYDLMSPSTIGDDPRSRDMLMSFAALMTLFTLVTFAARLLSSRQLRRIDAMSDEI